MGKYCKETLRSKANKRLYIVHMAKYLLKVCLFLSLSTKEMEEDSKEENEEKS